MTPLIVSSLPNHSFETGLKSQPIPLGFALVDEVLRDPQAFKADVVLMRAGYETDYFDETCINALKAELALKDMGAKIVNSVARLSHRKDIVYAVLGAKGIPIPRGLANPSPQEIRMAIMLGVLSYPFVYRLADGYAGRGMELVNNEAELEAAHKAFMEHKYAPHFRTMAVQFLLDKEGEHFARTRVYVIGDKIDLWCRSISSTWVVDGQCGTGVEDALRGHFVAANQTYKPPQALLNDCVKAGKILGLEIYSVDVMHHEGDHYILDVNPTYYYRSNERIFPFEMREARKGHFERVAKYLTELV